MSDSEAILLAALDFMQNDLNNEEETTTYERKTNDSQHISELNQLVNSFDEPSENITENSDDSIHLLSNPNNIFSKEQCEKSLIECTSVKCVCSVLKEYKTFIDALRSNTKKVTQNVSIENICQSVNTVNLLNDFIHLMQYHSHQFEDIYNLLKSKVYNNQACDLLTCICTARNHRNRNDSYQKLYLTNNIQEMIVQQYIDRIHCYYLHSIDAGFRLSKQERNNIMHEIEIAQNDDKKTNDIQRMRLTKGDQVQIFSESQTKWFNGTIMNITNDTKDEWLVVKYGSTQHKIKQIGRFSRFIRPINSKKYDTDSDNAYVRDRIIINDRLSKLTLNKQNRYKNMEGNISRNKNKFVTRKESNAAYKFGCRFFYHSEYKDLRRYDDPVGIASSLDFFIKHAANEERRVTLGKMYITYKYLNIKEELLNNPICSINTTQWQCIDESSTLHSETDEAKTIECPRTKSAKFYDMVNGDPLTQEHIISAQVYCNYDNLQSKFSKTYWPESKDEDLEDIKHRHRNYYWLGRRLRELVECFGMNRKKNTNISLYHGVNAQMKFDTLFAYVKAPCSTTLSSAVAKTFCGTKGMIVELDIDVKSWVFKILEDGPAAMNRICCFKMDWLSDYPQEQEVFTVGGLNRFHFTSIVTVSGVNYDVYIRGLRQMTTGMTHGGISLDGFNLYVPHTKLEKRMVYKLLAHQFWRYKGNMTDLNEKFVKEFKGCPEYIKNLMDSHCKQIKLISFFKTDPPHKILDLFFKNDNGVIKLQELMTIFPNTDYLRYNFTYEEVDNIITEPCVYESILSFIDANKDSKLNHIHLVVRPEKESDVEKFVRENYEKKFDERGWDINMVFYGIEQWNDALVDFVDLKALGIDTDKFDLGTALENPVIAGFIKMFIMQSETLYDVVGMVAKAVGLKEKFDVTKHYKLLEQHVLQIDKQKVSPELDVD